MGNALFVKRQISRGRQVYETTSRNGPTLTKSRDDPDFLWDREIQPLETFFLIWLQSNIDRNDQIQTTIKHLQNVVMHTRLMNDCDYLKKYLKEYKADDKIVLIISGEFAKKIVPYVHDFTSIIAIYVYSLEYTIDDEWIQDYWKVRNVISVVKELARLLWRDLTYITRIEDLNNQIIMHKPSVNDPLVSEMKEKLNQNVIQTGA